MATLTFIGHASFLLQTKTSLIYIDPWLEGNPACPPELKHIEKADAILVTHGHGDHLDTNLFEILSRTGAPLIAPTAVSQYLKQKGEVNAVFMKTGGTISVGDAEVTMTTAVHSANIEDGWPHESCGFLVRAEDMETTYFAGDTGIFSDMELMHRMYEPAVAVLPIGDRATMGAYQAAWATRLLGVQRVVPMHYGTFPFLTGTLEEFRHELARDPVEIVALKPGETTDV